MRIKRPEDQNEYLRTSQGMWVRNFTKKLVPYRDINHTLDKDDHFPLLKNEFENSRSRIPWIDTENFYHDYAVIISDGYGFEEKQELLDSLPPDVALIGVHGALRKWKHTNKRSLTYYIVNNPYEECMRYLPRRRIVPPRCIASTRTYSEFLAQYRGIKYRYSTVTEAEYDGQSSKEISYKIDDYRNAICAAIGLCYQFDVQKILLFCCDDVFKEERPAAEQLENGFWMYPQQRIPHGLVDANSYWIQHGEYQQTVVADFSSGPKYEHIGYINEDKIKSFLGANNE